MKVNLTHNGKPVTEPKSTIAFCSEPAIIQAQLETNDINIDIIKDIKENFVTLHKSDSFFFIETKEKSYFISTNSFYSKLPSSFQFVVVLINEDESLNEYYDDYYLAFRIKV
jgi:hypothetical protein